MGFKRLPHSLYKGFYCRQKGFKITRLPQQTTHIVMEGVLVKFHMQRKYKEEGHKCVEVAMVEEPPTLFFLNSFRPQNCCGLVLMLLTTCNVGGYGCPLGCKGKKGRGSVECETRLGLNGKHEPIANICLSANTNL